MADNKNIGGAAVAGLIGAVIGAAAGAAAVTLSDEKNRKKVQKAADKLQKEGGEKLEELKRLAHKFLEDTEEEKAKTQKKLPKVAQS